ncbi:MAG: tripartite tricarboxylate transporter substrate binding protein [Burkholderiaceae bacterium]
MQKRVFTKAALMTILGLASVGMGPVLASDSFPNKPIKIVVPAAPGGPTDTMGRVLAKFMSDKAGVPVIVENKAGAAGSIGVQAVVQSPPDGYTVVLAAIDAITVFPLVKKNPPYTWEKNLTPITVTATTPFVFGIGADLPVNSVKEFVELSKSRKLAFASPGVGASGHVVMEMFKDRTGAELLHVPYSGASPALLSIVGGDTHITATSPITLKGHIDSGRLKGLAVSSKARLPSLPDVPTMEESGVPDFVVTPWFGVLAPAGTPDAIADKLHELVVYAMRSEEYKDKIGGLGMTIEPMSRSEYVQMLTDETKRWREIIEAAHISSDD